jgi:phospholipid-binding lipoprotein MlaA
MRLILTCSLFALALTSSILAQEVLAQEATTAPLVVTQRDPWEGYNRWMFNSNVAIDKVTLKPLAKGYKAIAPQFFQRGFANAIQNTKEPWTFINAVLQGKGDTSMRTLGRFLINTTVGLGGLFNVAGKWGVQKDEEDLGQTLAVWGVPSGPYLMLPGFGPSNPRDFVGRIVKILYEPVNLVIGREVSSLAGYGQTAAELFDTRVGLLATADPILDKSDDPYITTRSAWYQNRTFKILDGKVPTQAGDDPFETDSSNETPAVPVPAPTSQNTHDKLIETSNLCVAHNCSAAEIDKAMDAARNGTSSTLAVAKALGR